MSKKLGLFMIVFLWIIQYANALADVSSPSLGYSHLGIQNTEYLLQQVEYSYDGNTTVETINDISYRKLSGSSSSLYMYFDIDDTLIYNGNAKDVFISVKYLDKGYQSFEIQYDGNNSVYQSSTDWIQLTNTEKIKTFTFLIENPKFSNRQTLGGDFRIAIPMNIGSLYIHSVVVQKAPGKYYPPSYANFNPPTYSSTDKLIIANPYYFWYKYGDGTMGCNTGCGNGDSENFYIYDGSDFLGDHMAGYSEPYQAGTKSQHSGFDYSYENKSTHKQELKDMMRADIDGLTADYFGNMSLYNANGYYSAENDSERSNNVYFPYTNLINYRANVNGKNISMIGLDVLSEAELELISQDKLKPPYIALFLETGSFNREGILKNAGTPVDLTTTQGKYLLWKLVRDFYSLVSPTLWLSIDNHPLIFLWGVGKNVSTSAWDSTAFDYVVSKFSSTFGKTPYFILTTDWGNINTQYLYGRYNWLTGSRSSCSDNGMCLGFGETLISINPGYNNWVTGNCGRGTNSDWCFSYDRGWDDFHGQTYTNSWQSALDTLASSSDTHNKNLLLIETWNELHEASGISNTINCIQSDNTYTNNGANISYNYSFIDDTASYNRGGTFHGIKAELSFITLPPQIVRKGQAFNVVIRVKNIGNGGTWHYLGENAGSVKLGNHRVNPNGSRLVDDARAILPTSLRKNESVDITLPITAPLTVGLYQYEFDMVKEGQFWFEYIGSTVLRTPYKTQVVP